MTLDDRSTTRNRIEEDGGEEDQETRTQSTLWSGSLPVVNDPPLCCSVRLMMTPQWRPPSIRDFVIQFIPWLWFNKARSL